MNDDSMVPYVSSFSPWDPSTIMDESMTVTFNESASYLETSKTAWKLVLVTRIDVMLPVGAPTTVGLEMDKFGKFESIDE